LSSPGFGYAVEDAVILAGLLRQSGDFAILRFQSGRELLETLLRLPVERLQFLLGQLVLGFTFGCLGIGVGFSVRTRFCRGWRRLLGL
jgi:hypothetical protein